ncbi:MAG: type II toxin-antitoxin system VapC family toxin [Candidatus Jordarchaeaceae archaeon]
MNSIGGLTIYIPKIFLIELISVTKRLGISMSRKDIERLVTDFEILDEDFIFEEAFKITEESHPRAVDSYFIAVAKLTNSVLISCDRIRVENGKKYGIRAYYLLEELDDAIKAVRKLKKGER